MNQDSGNLQHFNSQFVEMWKETKNYREWRHFLRTIDSSTSEKLCHISPRHPYAGNHGLSVTGLWQEESLQPKVPCHLGLHLLKHPLLQVRPLWIHPTVRNIKRLSVRRKRL